MDDVRKQAIHSKFNAADLIREARAPIERHCGRLFVEGGV